MRELQTLLLSKTAFPELEDAQEWAREHGYHAEAVDSQKNTWRLRQRDPSRFRPGTFRTVQRSVGVLGVYADLIQEERSDMGEHLTFLQERLGELKKQQAQETPGSRSHTILGQEIKHYRALIRAGAQNPVELPKRGTSWLILQPPIHAEYQARDFDEARRWLEAHAEEGVDILEVRSAWEPGGPCGIPLYAAGYLVLPEVYHWNERHPNRVQAEVRARDEARRSSGITFVAEALGRWEEPRATVGNPREGYAVAILDHAKRFMVWERAADYAEKQPGRTIIHGYGAWLNGEPKTVHPNGG